MLTHPGSHLSVGTVDRAGAVLDPAGARVYGVQRQLDERRLVGAGWTVAAKTSGGLGVLTGRPAHTLAGAEMPMDAALGCHGRRHAVEHAGGEVERVDPLRSVLEERRRPAAGRPVEQARAVTAVAAHAEHDRAVVRVEQLAAGGRGRRPDPAALFSRHLG